MIGEVATTSELLAVFAVNVLLPTYLIVGCIVALVVLFTVFQPDYDEFVEEYFDEVPPTTSQKWFVVFTTPFIWPHTLFKAFT